MKLSYKSDLIEKKDGQQIRNQRPKVSREQPTNLQMTRKIFFVEQCYYNIKPLILYFPLDTVDEMAVNEFFCTGWAVSRAPKHLRQF